MTKMVSKRMVLQRRKRAALSSEDKIDYKNVWLLRRFVSDQGKILSRRVSRLTAKQQRLMTRTIKSARILAMLPFLNNKR